MGADLSWDDFAAGRLVRLVSLPSEDGRKVQFPGTGKYLFLDEDTILYTGLLPSEQGEGLGQLRYYRVEEDGSLSTWTVELEGPPLAADFDPQKALTALVHWLPGHVVTGILPTEQGMECFTWGDRDGKLIFRGPGENAHSFWRRGILEDGTIYWTEDTDYEEGRFTLFAYDIRKDQLEPLATGAIPIDPDPIMGKGEAGYFSNVVLTGVHDGVFSLRAWFLWSSGWRDGEWDPAKGGPVEFGEIQPEPVFPEAWEVVELLTTLPDGRLLVLVTEF